MNKYLLTLLTLTLLTPAFARADFVDRETMMPCPSLSAGLPGGMPVSDRCRIEHIRRELEAGDASNFYALLDEELARLSTDNLWMQRPVTIDGLRKFRSAFQTVHFLLDHGMWKYREDPAFGAFRHHSIGWVALDLAMMSLERGDDQGWGIILEHSRTPEGFHQAGFLKLLRRGALPALSWQEIWPNLGSTDPAIVKAASAYLARQDSRELIAHIGKLTLDAVQHNDTGMNFEDLLSEDRPGEDSLAASQPFAFGGLTTLYRMKNDSGDQFLRDIYLADSTDPFWKNLTGLVLAERSDPVAADFVYGLKDHPNPEIREWAEKRMTCY